MRNAAKLNALDEACGKADQARKEANRRLREAKVAAEKAKK